MSSVYNLSDQSRNGTPSREQIPVIQFRVLHFAHYSGQALLTSHCLGNQAEVFRSSLYDGHSLFDAHSLYDVQSL